MAVNNKSMKMIYTLKGKWIFAFIFVCVFVLLWVRHMGLAGHMFQSESDSEDAKNSDAFILNSIPPFENKLKGFDIISDSCYKKQSPQSIEDLHKFVFMLRDNKGRKICQEQYKLFNAIYRIRVKQTTVKLSDTFLPKVRRWMNGNEELVEATKRQTIIFVDNKWSLESVVFNPVRSKRPGGQGVGSVAAYVKQIVDKAKDGCDFCAYKNFTAVDDFGLLESEKTVAISNTFKIEKYHGMIVFKKHDPVHFDLDQFIDAVDLAMRWYDKTHHLVPTHKYRFMYWDILPKASASQIHPHLHLTLGDSAYYTKWNILHKAALSFSKSIHHLNYWNALLQVHTSLGLTEKLGKASIVAYITPQKDLEVLIMAKKPSLDFFKLYYYAVRIFMDEMGQYALSSGCVFPKIGSNPENGAELPMICRLLSRGAADLPRSDISSFDLFGTPNVNKDPFEVIKKIRSALSMKEDRLTLEPKYLY